MDDFIANNEKKAFILWNEKFHSIGSSIAFGTVYPVAEAYMHVSLHLSTGHRVNSFIPSWSGGPSPRGQQCDNLGGQP
jgi:hypothetical protein